MNYDAERDAQLRIAAMKCAQRMDRKGYDAYDYDTMLVFADERLEAAAERVQYADAALGRHDLCRLIRSYKSTTPEPPETREQRLERALREIAAADFPRLGGIHGLIALAKDALDEARTEES